MIEESLLLPASFQLKCIMQMRVVATIVRCKEQGSLITNQATFLAQVGRYSKIFKFPFARKFWSARCGAYVTHTSERICTVF